MTRLLPALWLAGCAPPAPEAGDPPEGPSGVVLVTAAVDYTAGALAAATPDGTVSDLLATIHSDAVVQAEGSVVYVVNRLLMDTVRRIDPPAWGQPTWEASVGPGTNPQAVATCGGALWVSRYGHAELLRLDPETGEALGTLSLAAWADEDGLPEASDLVVLGPDTLAVGLQRLRRTAGWLPDATGQVAVVDCAAATVRDVWPVGPNPTLRGPDPLVVISEGAASTLDPENGTLANLGDDADLVDGQVDAAGAVWIARDGEAHAWRCVDADGSEIAGPWIDRYITDVALAPDGTAWISARPPWSDPLAPGGVIVVERDTCEVRGSADGLATAMPPYAVAVWGPW
jgi:hypothetical protein